ncbi:predicted protein [Uncinocarpus reesii 1704]|uniref:Uncharacterized protein n=1 Tax=Uncinocarpus reesii (strain UAMH 1704) TaxID=336963 RepID=C4JNT3_UNCRE|nr:uncharacterized protein UREG_04403 [Uncinocarpus reesii 1704]EEP79557.1 predicted protein [Uncinocarpus reesii 1704]
MGTIDARAGTSDVVHLGFWVDYDGNSISKYRLTLKTNLALILLAALTVLVTLCASRSWKLWSSAAHYALERSHRKPSSISSIRQQQVILRNSETAGGSLFALLGLAITKRPLRSPGWVSQLSLVFLSLGHWIVFVALGILTSQIVTGRTVRAIRTDHCGDWLPKAMPSLDASLAEQQEAFATLNELALNSTLEADDYVRRCYGSTSYATSECTQLSKRYLSHQIEDTECVFSKEVCSEVNGTAVAFDSGNVSFADLGLNSALSDRLFFRRRSVCSPLPWRPFMYTQDQALLSLQSYGANVIEDPKEIQAFSHVKLDEFRNWTTHFRSTLSETYGLYTELAMNGTRTSPLIRPQTQSMQVSVITVMGEIISYHSPFSDPFFNFQSRIDGVDALGREFIFYRIGPPINSVACQEMVMYCSEYTNFCTQWEGVYFGSHGNIYASLVGDHANDTTVETAFTAVGMALFHSTIYSSISDRGNSALLATRFVANQRQLRLVPGQWKIEIERWFQVALARVQLVMLRYVKTPGLDRTRVENMWDLIPVVKGVCSIVKFNSAEHTTLSTLGVFIIVAFSLLLTILSMWDMALPIIPKRLLTAWNRDQALELLDALNKSDTNHGLDQEGNGIATEDKRPHDLEGNATTNLLSPSESVQSKLSARKPVEGENIN